MLDYASTVHPFLIAEWHFTKWMPQCGLPLRVDELGLPPGPGPPLTFHAVLVTGDEPFQLFNA